MRIDFDPDGWAQARRRLQAMRERTSDVSPAWDVLLTWWAARNVTHFRSKGRRWRTPWPALKPETVQEKLRLGYPAAPLIRTGALRTSLVSRPLGMERISPHEVVAGTRVRYAPFHQSGTRFMPKRPLVNADAVRQEGVATQAVINWIVDGRRSTRSTKAAGE